MPELDASDHIVPINEPELDLVATREAGKNLMREDQTDLVSAAHGELDPLLFFQLIGLEEEEITSANEALATAYVQSVVESFMMSALFGTGKKSEIYAVPVDNAIEDLPDENET